MAQFGLTEAGGGVGGAVGSNHSSSTMLDNSFKGGGGSSGGGSGNNSDTNNGPVGGGGMVKSNSTNLSHSSSNLSAGSNNSNSGNQQQTSHHQSRGEGRGEGSRGDGRIKSHQSIYCGQPNNNSSLPLPVRNVGVGPMRRPADRKIDTSPYGNNIAYLSPPSDSSWRRTSSDSAIHQSLNQQQVRY